MKTFDIYEEAIEYSTSNPSETVEYKEYHDSGQLRNHCFYVNGLVHGESKSYHYNGRIMYHYFYVNCKPHGEYKSYYSCGRLMHHCFYISGNDIKLDHLKDSSYKSLCIKHTLFDGNVIDEDI